MPRATDGPGPRSSTRRPAARRATAAPPPPPPPPAAPSLQDAIGGLLRLPWAVLDLLDAETNLRRALEAPARIERLALAVDRTVTLLEVLVTEVDPERVRETMRRLDRLAATAEKGASLVDRIDAEIDIERLADTFSRVSQLAATAEDVAATLTDAAGGRLSQAMTMLDRILSVVEEMNRNIGAIEHLLEGVRSVVGAPLERLPIPGVLRRVMRDAGTGSAGEPGGD